MRKPMSLPLYVLVVVTLLLSLVPPATMAQSRCPEPLVKDPDQDICIDPETGLYVPPEEYPTEVPPPPPEPPVPPVGDLASFTLYHLTCDSDFDPNGVRDAGGLGPANGCLTYGKPAFTYTITANGIPVTTATLDATERDFARFEVPPPIPAGTLTIAVVPVAPYSTEFISCGLEIGEAGTDIVEPPIAGGSATLTTLPDQKVECWVYNVNREPPDQGADAGQDEVVGDGNSVGDTEVDDSQIIADPSGGTSGSITIAAYLCPAGVTATDDLIAACTQRAGGQAFSLLTASETLETQTSDAEGDILFTGVPANEYGIAATLPPGYGEPIVLCYVADPIGNVFEGQEDVVFGNQIRLRLGDGFTTECAWYNVPASGPDNGPNIYIQARLCGADVEITQTMSVFDAEALCGVVYQNEEFQVQINGEVIATKRTGDGALTSGQVFFTKLPAPGGGGVYGITADLRDGDQVLGVFCDQNYGGDRFVTVTTNIADGNRIDQELLEGWTLRCSWFFELNPLLQGTQVASEQPELDPTSMAATEQALNREPGITVLARLCPQEVVEQQVDLAVACSVPGEGITFDIAIGGGPSSTQATDENGELDVVLGVGPATYLINNQPTPGISEPEVFCTIIRADGTTEQVSGFVTAGSPGQEFAFDGASEVTCIFYFLGEPTGQEQGDPAEGIVAPPEDQVSPAANAREGEVGSEEASWEPGITVQARLCPPEVAGQDEALDEICTEPANGFTFEILVDDESTGTYVTDPNGEFAIPAEVGPGQYLFRHQPGSDQLELQTVCSSIYENGSTATGRSRATGPEMSEIYLTYDGASSITCTFYFVLDSAAPETDDSTDAPEDQVAEGESETGAAAPHALTIQFWTCPGGTDTAADQVDLVQACSTDTVERSFMLTVDGDTMGQTVTGTATWEFLDPTISADIGSSLPSSAWCTSEWVDIGEDTIDIPDTVELDGGALTLTVSHPATAIYCDWYLFPG